MGFFNLLPPLNHSLAQLWCKSKQKISVVFFLLLEMVFKKRWLKEYFICCCRKKNKKNVFSKKVIEGFNWPESCSWIPTAFFTICLLMQKIMFFMVSLSCYQQQSWVAFPSLHSAVWFPAFERVIFMWATNLRKMRGFWEEKLDFWHSLPTVHSSELRTKSNRNCLYLDAALSDKLLLRCFDGNWWLKDGVFFCI